MASRTLLIDGDILVYRAACVSEKEIHWDDDVHTLHCDFAEARENVQSQLDRLVARLGATKVIIGLSDPTGAYFRKEVYKPYKSNRKAIRKPLALARLREWVTDEFQTYQRPGLEGDDILGILATSDKLGGEKIIVSIDKDFKTVPCRLYRGEAEEGQDAPEIIDVSEDEAAYNHLLQTLVGDATDGYPGCPGVGKVKGAKLLDAAGPSQTDRWDAVVGAFTKAVGEEEAYEEALTQARLARILRAEDYDLDTKKVKLWTP